MQTRPLRRVAFSIVGYSLLAMARPSPASWIHFVARRDDRSAIDWFLDRQQAPPRQGILVVAQGSGCASARTNANLVRAKSLLPAFAVVAVEKHGVRPGDEPADPMGGCSETFYLRNTVSQRVADYQRVLEMVETSKWWNGQLVLVGGSEGGAAVSMLAPKVKPNAVVILSTAPERSFRKAFKLVVPPEVAAQADSELAKIDSDPLSAKTWGGNSYRWWADVLDHDFTADILSVNAPILLVQGERDKSAPVQGARQVRDEFLRAGRCNLTYWEFTGYDHQMQDASGISRIDDVMQRIAGWLTTKLDRRGSIEVCGSNDRGR
jgi:pimeloyl-ACP methyl ester carboxylesterase